MSNFTTVDLFCGAGGFTEGFRKAGDFETILSVDFDKQAIDTFKHNHPTVKTICKDFTILDGKEHMINKSRTSSIALHSAVAEPNPNSNKLLGKLICYLEGEVRLRDMVTPNY